MPVTRNDYEKKTLRIIFAFIEGSCALEFSGKERLCQGIACEIRKFGTKMMISESFFVSNNFVSGSKCLP